MATLNYDFVPDDEVWHVTADQGIKKGTIVSVEANITTTTTVVTYHVRYDGDVGTTAIIDDLYTLLSDALTAYETLLTA